MKVYAVVMGEIENCEFFRDRQNAVRRYEEEKIKLESSHTYVDWAVVTDRNHYAKDGKKYSRWDGWDIGWVTDLDLIEVEVK